jgi:hypothetical protein
MVVVVLRTLFMNYLRGLLRKVVSTCAMSVVDSGSSIKSRGKSPSWYCHSSSTSSSILEEAGEAWGPLPNVILVNDALMWFAMLV